MLSSLGLRIAVAGGLVLLAGAISLLFLPKAISIAALIAGGMGVWIGFVQTMLAWYRGGSPPPEV